MKIENVQFRAFDNKGMKGFVQFDLVGEVGGKELRISFKDWTIREFTKDGKTRISALPPSKAPKEGSADKWMPYIYAGGDGWWSIQDQILAAAGFGSGPPVTQDSGSAVGAPAQPAKPNPYKKMGAGAARPF